MRDSKLMIGLVAGFLAVSLTAGHAARHEQLSVTELTVQSIIAYDDPIEFTGGIKFSGDLSAANVTSEGLIASKPVFSDVNKQLTSVGILGVDQGGTGTNTITEHGLIVGAGTARVTVLAEATDGQLPIGDSGAVPVLATLTGTENEVDISNGAGTITIGLVDPLIVAKGGSGVATLTEHGVVIGNAAAAVSVTAVGTDGQMFIGASTADPGWQTASGLFTMNASGVASGIAGYLMPAFNIVACTNLPSTGMDAAGETSLGLADSATQPGDNWTGTVNSVVAATVTDGAALGATALQPTGDGSGVTNISVDNVTAGNLSTNFGGAGTLSGILKATAGVVAPAVADTDYVQVSSVYGSATSVNGAIASGQLIVTNTITMLDLAGATFVDYTKTHVWMSESANGAITTNNIESVVLDGTEVDEKTVAADYIQVTPATGIMIATITATASGTNYVNVGVGPRITSTEIIFIP